ncbi:HrpE/YscL family type III secretion apparatus protein [Variovorax sp. KK3]|uniref:HrpE/YscL family type III secretion apparatus protein n=1 Tax=Variovorax sp. KK3 TaxID=1855728 RepID=UPI00097CB8AC|nr:HrpE/YscL family type III secretion apparatus protein [Variovorax sp. KK3]
MVFIVRDSSALTRPEPSQKVVKAHQVWTYREAEEVIAEALRCRDQILSDARTAFEAEKRKGYDEGSELARLDQSGRMVELVARTSTYFARVEQRMVDLVVSGVQSVISDFGDRHCVASLVARSLAEVRSQKQVTVRVHPDHAAAIREQVADLIRTYPAIECVDVVADVRIPVDAVAVETDIGIVEASATGQIDALKQALRTAFDESA